MSSGTPVTATATTIGGPRTTGGAYASPINRRAVVRFGTLDELNKQLANGDLEAQTNPFRLADEKAAAEAAQAPDPLAAAKEVKTTQVETRKDSAIRQAFAAAAVRSGNESDLLGNKGAKKRGAARAILGGD